jgi:ABC-type branched-subunit amino acid transport system ATPase component
MILGVEKVKKSFDGFVAIDGVSFSIPKGEICSIIGPNGAGKTTLFNLITGHLPIDEGKLTFKIWTSPTAVPNQICRLGSRSSSDQHFPRLTVSEHPGCRWSTGKEPLSSARGVVLSGGDWEIWESRLKEYAQTVSGLSPMV